MKYGMNLLLWSGELHEGLLPVLESLKEMGFDGVELPMFRPGCRQMGPLGKTAG